MSLDQLIRLLLRDRLGTLIAWILAPASLMFLGLLWLGEHDLLLPFLLAAALAVGVWRLGRFIALRRSKPTPAPSVRPLVKGNPEWTETEQAAFSRLCAVIAERVAEPLPWEALQSEAFQLLERAASELSGGKRGALEFTIPEALLLADRVLGRLRRDLRRYVPLAEQVRISTLLWFWSQRRKIFYGITVGRSAWRLKRVVTNPLGAVLQEAQSLLLGPANAELQFAGKAGLQRVLLEEIAAAAIDLHGGYLRFTEAELLEIDLAATEADQGRLVQEDHPLRVLVVGQTSAGKSSLINALANESLSETDMAPTTPGFAAHPWVLEEANFTFVDSPGIDGTKAVENQLLTELLQADAVIWAVRSNRPARSPDVALLSRLHEACDAAGRRRPPVILALTAVDLLLPGWPFPEHLFSREAQASLSDIITAVSADFSERRLVPLCLEPPEWNLAALKGQILATLPEALMVQRNRRRLENRTSARSEIAKGVSGISQAAKFVTERWRS